MWQQAHRLIGAIGLAAAFSAPLGSPASAQDRDVALTLGVSPASVVFGDTVTATPTVNPNGQTATLPNAFTYQ